ncbi:MAG: response regulator [Acidaminococcales bacterium]|jgi:two-component system response regulator DctR|nr:response regulator [Acidaminococcales bacterium]
MKKSERKTTILAIDDEKDIHYTLQAIGKAMNWLVYTESDPLTALARIYDLKPDVILLDYHMPRCNGLAALREIRKVHRDIPVIVLTVDERQEASDEFLDAGANDFANKPIRVPDLVARINVHLQLLQKQQELQLSAFATKGVNLATLKLVYAYCQKQAGWFTIDEAAVNVGLAYQTTVRYLQYLLGQKKLEVMSGYGKIGRPRNKYRWARENELL